MQTNFDIGSDADPSKPGFLTKTEVERYTRQLILDEVGLSGQQKLKAARVLVVGAGGIGSGVIPYLAAAGIGTIGIIDDDKVEVTNLHRQVLHNEDLKGCPKVDSAESFVSKLNPHVKVEKHAERLTQTMAEDLVTKYDVILDGSDNPITRYIVNDACVIKKVKLTHAESIDQWSGCQVGGPAHHLQPRGWSLLQMLVP